MIRRFTVVRYPTYYVVIDTFKDNKIIWETRTQDAAHRKADELNKA